MDWETSDHMMSTMMGWIIPCKGEVQMECEAFHHETYTDDKCTDEGSWKSQFVCVGYQATPNNCRSVTCKREL